MAEENIIIRAEDLEPLEALDGVELWKLLQAKEQQEPPRIPFDTLGASADTAGGFFELKEGLGDPSKKLDFKYGGASGIVTKLDLKTGETVALKVLRDKPEPYQRYDLVTEKRALMRLSDLWGKGVVRLLGTATWQSNLPEGSGLVKEWVNGKVLGEHLMPSWSRLEDGQGRPQAEDIEGAKLVLSVLDVLEKIHQHKVAWGDSRRDDAIWNGSSVTLIDFAQAPLAHYDTNEKKWFIYERWTENSDFDNYLSWLELPAVLGDFFFRYTSKPEDSRQMTNQHLQDIFQKYKEREYHSAKQVKVDLARYFLSLGMTEKDLGLPLRIGPEDLS